MKLFSLRLMPRWGMGLALWAALAALPSCGRRGPVKEKYRETKLLMGTFVQVDACYRKGREDSLRPVFAKVWARLDEIQKKMNNYDADSEISKINASYPAVIRVDPEMYRILEMSRRDNAMTHGVFDVTAGALINLWKQVEKDGKAPSAETVAALKKHTGWRLVRLVPPDKVQLLDPEVRLDLGGIAKGYAVDEAAKVLRDNGVRDFFIDAGGDIYAGGQSCAGRPWRIGVRNPRQKDAIIDAIEVKDQSVTTSGDYEQYAMIKGRRYSHIIDPRTGYPQSGVISATVVAPTAEQADALATALCILPEKEGLGIIASLGKGYAAYLVGEGGGAGTFKISTDRAFRRMELNKK